MEAYEAELEDFEHSHPKQTDWGKVARQAEADLEKARRRQVQRAENVTKCQKELRSAQVELELAQTDIDEIESRRQEALRQMLAASVPGSRTLFAAEQGQDDYMAENSQESLEAAQQRIADLEQHAARLTSIIGIADKYFTPEAQRACNEHVAAFALQPAADPVVAAPVASEV